MHVKRPGIHFLVSLQQWLLLACGVSGIFYFQHSWGWIPFAVIAGFAIFNFTVLLHEVLHGLVFGGRRPRSHHAFSS